jgi:hypothetical protein
MHMKHRAIVEAVLLFTVIYQQRPTAGGIARLLGLKHQEVHPALTAARTEGWLDEDRPFQYTPSPQALSDLLSQPGLPWVLNIHRRLATMHRGPVTVDSEDGPAPGTEGLSL